MNHISKKYRKVTTILTVVVLLLIYVIPNLYSAIVRQFEVEDFRREYHALNDSIEEYIVNIDFDDVGGSTSSDYHKELFDKINAQFKYLDKFDDQIYTVSKKEQLQKQLDNISFLNDYDAQMSELSEEEKDDVRFKLAGIEFITRFEQSLDEN